jgi:transposase
MSTKPIPLTDHDLRQMDDEWVSALTSSEKEALLVRALFELRKSRDRLNQSPRNSSKPPSTRAPWEPTANNEATDEPSGAEGLADAAPATADDDTAQADKAATPGKTTVPKSTGGKDAAKKKAGKQAGAQGFGRTQKLAYTNVDAHYPDVCAGCGKCLARDGALAYTAWDDVDIAEKVAGQVGLYLKATRHTLYASPCVCGHVTRAAHNVAPDDPFWDKVALGQWRLIGPRLAGAIVFLALRMRLSRARIREFFIELFDLQLSTGVLDETIREAGRAVAALEDEMVQDIEQAVLLHADETPWKEAGKPLWMWVFVAGFTTLFYICSRGLEILANVLTSTFKGNLMSDGYQAYRHLGRRLRCWAHLIRKCRGLIDSTDAKVVAAGKGMHDVLHTLMAAIYGARAAPDQESGALAIRHAADIERLRVLCERHRDSRNDKLRALAREFLLDWEVILRQVAEPDLPLTNNAAEQALRHWVIARRISMGTRSEAGTRAFALLASVIETCRKRSASSWVFIASVIAAARKGLTIPSLPAIPVGV